MDTNILGIGAIIGGFFAYYTWEQKKVLKRRRAHPKPQPMPDLHTDSFGEDVCPVMHSAHPANLKGPYRVEVIEDNDAFFVPTELTSVKEDTLSLRAYSTGKSPIHRELFSPGKPQTSAIPWVQERAHVAAEEFLKKEGLIPQNKESQANSDYFQLWPEPKQHPYQ